MEQNLGELVGVIFAAKENLPMEAMLLARATDLVTEKNSYQGRNSKGHGGRAQGSSPSSTPD